MTAKGTGCNESSEPILPVEVLRAIFETAYRDSPGDALRLMLAAKCVYEWLLPLVYCSLVFEGRSGSAKFGRLAFGYMFHSEALDSLLSRFTRRVSFRISVDRLSRQTQQFFEACPNLVELHYRPEDRWRDEVAEEKVLRAITNMPLERLSVGFESGKLFGLKDVDMSTTAMSRTLTHLDVSWRECSPSHLMHLRSLTHFAVMINRLNDRNMMSEIIPDLLERKAPDYKRVKIIIVEPFVRRTLGNEFKLIRDERILEMWDK